MTTDNKTDIKQLIDTTFATIIDSPNAETELLKEGIRQTSQEKQSTIVINTKMADTLKQLYLKKSNYDNDTKRLIQTLIQPTGNIHPTIKTHQLDTTHLSTIIQQKLSTKETLIAELETQKNIKQQDPLEENTKHAIESFLSQNNIEFPKDNTYTITKDKEGSITSISCSIKTDKTLFKNIS